MPMDRAHRHAVPARAKILVATALVFVVGLWYVNGGESAIRRWTGATADHQVGDLLYTAPRGWYVTGPSATGTRSYPAGAMEQGDFLSTVPTGDTCTRTQESTQTVTTCDTAQAVVTVPADGAITWISMATVLPGWTDGTDPNPAAVRICSGSPERHLYHADRTLGTAGSQTRVAIDGCLYGPNYLDYKDLLDRTMASFRVAS
jgi:hypothetical protein